MRMNAYQFLELVEDRIESLSKDEYFLKKNESSKWLLEEALPIAKLAISLKQPGLKIEVEAYEDDREEDGFITETGFRSNQFPLQVTHCYSYEQALRDEELALKGSTFGAGPITRDKKSGKVVSKAGVQDIDAHIAELIENIAFVFEKKNKKNYATKMVLIISFSEVKLAGLSQWVLFFEQLRGQVNFSSSSFLRVYLYNSASNEIQRVT
jgi:hypothetical protein